MAGRRTYTVKYDVGSRNCYNKGVLVRYFKYIDYPASISLLYNSV